MSMILNSRDGEDYKVNRLLNVILFCWKERLFHAALCLFVWGSSLTLMQAVIPGPEELSCPVGLRDAGRCTEGPCCLEGNRRQLCSVSWGVNTGDYSSFVVEYEEALLAAGPLQKPSCAENRQVLWLTGLQVTLPIKPRCKDWQENNALLWKLRLQQVPPFCY